MTEISERKDLKGSVDSGKCLKCKSKIVREEVWRDVSPYDAYNETTYSIPCCSNEDCQIGQGAKKNWLAELNYWKELADELGIPDLKYWQLNYERSSNCFWVIVEDIWEEEEVGEPKHVWKEPISPEAISEAFGSRLVDALTWDKVREGGRFRELITESLKLMATEIKKDRSGNSNR